jgi:hypothetical protein
MRLVRFESDRHIAVGRLPILNTLVSCALRDFFVERRMFGIDWAEGGSV